MYSCFAYQRMFAWILAIILCLLFFASDKFVLNNVALANWPTCVTNNGEFRVFHEFECEANRKMHLIICTNATAQRNHFRFHSIAITHSADTHAKINNQTNSERIAHFAERLDDFTLESLQHCSSEHQFSFNFSHQRIRFVLFHTTH